MIVWLQYIFYMIIVLASCISVFYSFKSRREQDPQKRGLVSAKMNIALGIMLVSIACLVLLFHGSSIRIIVGALFLLLGLFNVFAGIRNYSFYNVPIKQESEAPLDLDEGSET